MSINIKNSDFLDLEEGMACPKCGRPLVERNTERGVFLGCTGYPECDFMRAVTSSHQVIALGEVGAPCPKCGGMLEVKKGRYGIFIGCSNYPGCSYVYKHTEKSDISCPICKKGVLVKRSSRSGRTFYGCSNYPECSFLLPGKPRAITCKSCSFPVMFEKKVKNGIALCCGNSLCPSRKSRKYLLLEKSDLEE